jgi:hypothetical protein
LRSNPEHRETDHGADRHDPQLKPKLQLIENNQRQKRHRADLKKDTKMMQHCQKLRRKFVGAVNYDRLSRWSKTTPSFVSKTHCVGHVKRSAGVPSGHVDDAQFPFPLALSAAVNSDDQRRRRGTDRSIQVKLEGDVINFCEFDVAKDFDFEPVVGINRRQANAHLRHNDEAQQAKAHSLLRPN